MTRPLDRVRTALLTFALYGGIAALALYWPLFNAASHVGGTLPTDYYHFHWNYGWIRHALAHGWSIYETNYVLFPAVTNLAYHTLTPVWYPLWALLEPLTGTFRALNAIHWLALTLNGWAAYGCARRFGVPAAYALAGGVVYLLTPAVLLAAFITNPNYVAIFWYPLLLIVWQAISRAHTERDRLAWAVTFGAALWGMLLTDLQHGLFSAFILAPYIAYTLLIAPSWKLRWRMIGAGVLAGGVFMGLFALIGPLFPLLAFDRSSLSPMPITAAGGIPFPLGYGWRIDPYTRLISLGALVLPVTLAALVYGVLRRRGHGAIWAIALLPPLVLALGPTVMIGGQTIATPYVLFHELFGGLFRSPARFAPVIVLAALLFSGVTLAPALRSWTRTPGRRAAFTLVAVGLALLDGRVFQPMPLMPIAPEYAFYRAIGAETGPAYDRLGVLNVPVAGGTGEAWVGEFPPMETQIYGLLHHKPMLNGSLARAPLAAYWHWLYDDGLLAWLGQRRYYEPFMREQLAERITAWPIGYIVLHQHYTPRERPTNHEWIGALNQWRDLVCVRWVERDAIAWITAAHPGFDQCPPRTPPLVDGAYVIDIGGDDAAHLGWGWHYAETVGGITARWLGAQHPVSAEPTDTPPVGVVYVDVPPGASALSFTAQAYREPRRVQVTVNDQPIGEPVMVRPDALETFRMTIPAAAIGDGQQVAIALNVDAGLRPADVDGSADQRRLALLVDTITLMPEGADE